jgi:hypothetical protein
MSQQVNVEKNRNKKIYGTMCLMITWPGLSCLGMCCPLFKYSGPVTRILDQCSHGHDEFVPLKDGANDDDLCP